MQRLAPADYAAFVAAHRARLSSACRGLTGNSHLAEAVARELMAVVALRWRWLRRGGAEAYLDRLIRREARAWRAEIPKVERGRPRRTLLVGDAPIAAGPLAALAWATARTMRARRRAAAAVAVAVLGCFAAIGPRDPLPIPDTLPIPTREPMPPGVSVLPPFTLLGGLWPFETRLPVTLPVDPATAAPLTASPIAAAVAVLRQDPRPLLAVAPDGTARRVDDPAVAGARLLPTSLSPDGQRVALLTPEAVRVLDLTTGRVRSIAAAQTAVRTLVWRDDRTVMLPGPDGAEQINVDTGALTDVPAVSGNDVAAGASAGPLMELVGSGGVQRALVRLWHNDPVSAPADGEHNVDERPIFGPPWVGLWRGAAWSTMEMLARGCDPAAVRLPAAIGRATAAVAAIRPNGLVAGTLVTLDATAMDIVGFAGGPTVLINVTAAPAASILLAWDPTNGEVRRVTTRSPYLQISVADLRAPPSVR